jgi:hypothetical protein
MVHQFLMSKGLRYGFLGVSTRSGFSVLVVPGPVTGFLKINYFLGLFYVEPKISPFSFHKLVIFLKKYVSIFVQVKDALL